MNRKLLLRLEFITLIFFCLIFFSWNSGLAQYTPWKSFSTAHGLGDVEVYTIYESPSTGDLWFGTKNGATRYDGTWKNFILDSVVPAGNKVRAIVNEGIGRMWFGTENGLRILQYGTVVPGFDILKNCHIWAIEKEDNNNWWFGTSYGAFQFRPDSIVEWRKYIIQGDSATNNIRDILIDKDDNIWFGTFNGIYCMDSNSNWIGSYLESSIITDIFKDKDDNLWIATDGYGGFKLENGIMNPIDEVPLPVRLSAITQDWEGRLFFTSYEGGVTSFFEGTTKWDVITSQDGLAHNAVFDVEEDCFRNIWFATRYNGVSRFERSWQNYLSSDIGLPSNEIFSLEKDNNDNIWAGLNDAGIFKFNGRDFEKKYPFDNSNNYDIYCMGKGTDSTMWFGTKDQGVLKFDGIKWETLQSPQFPFGNNWILSIFKDTFNDLWFGTKGGGVTWFQVQDSNWVPYTTDSGLVNNSVKDIIEDNQGLMWFATNKGVSCFDREEQQFVDIDSINFPLYIYNSITKDDRGNLWFSTQEHGVVKYNGTDLEYFQTDSGLVSNQIHTVQFDSINKKLWFGSDRGVNYLNLKYGQHSWQLFTDQNSGLIDSDSWTNSILIDHEIKRIDSNEDTVSVLWFGTKNGIARYQGEIFPPETYILKPEKDNHIFVTANPVFEVFARDNISSAFELSYSYLILKIDSVGTKHQLFGGWSGFSFNNQIMLPGALENGGYEIQVRARDSENNIDPSPEIRKFKIDQLLTTQTVEGSKENYLFTYDDQRQVKIYFPPNTFNKSINIKINTLIDTIVTPSIKTFFKFEVFAVDQNNKKVEPAPNFENVGTISIRDTINIFRSNLEDDQYPALYHKVSAFDRDWNYIGGTADFTSQTLSVPFRSFGQYLVGFGDRVPDNGIITGLNCRPRVFSTCGSNPSNNTLIVFTLGKTVPVTIKIYNVAGRLIRSLKTGEQLFVGENAVSWDGKNEENENCVSGLYIICVVVEGKKQLKTVAIVNI